MKKAFFYVILIFSIINLFGCANNEEGDSIYGQGLVKYSTLYDTDNELSFEFPIISRTEIEKFSIEGYLVSGEGNYVINDRGLTGGQKYNGYYYYFSNVTVGIDCQYRADFEIKSVEMKINGKSVNYVVDKMYFTNIKGKYEDGYAASPEIILYENGGPLHLLNEISEDSVYEVILGVRQDCLIREIGYLDFLEMNNVDVKVNGESVEFNENLILKEGDYVSFKYNLSYKDGISKNGIIKTSFYVDFMSNEQNYLFIDEQGIIIVDMNNDNFIKKYIDEELMDK